MQAPGENRMAFQYFLFTEPEGRAKILAQNLSK
jgi:hypothetical protein